jgi:hypothetical protein
MCIPQAFIAGKATSGLTMHCTLKCVQHNPTQIYIQPASRAMSCNLLCCNMCHTLHLQAFIAGKATSGLTMASLRVLSKGVMPQTLSGLRLSTVMCVSIAGALVLCCFFLSALLLPKLKKQIVDMQEKRPGTRAGLRYACYVCQTQLPAPRCCCTCTGLVRAFNVHNISSCLLWVTMGTVLSEHVSI